MFDNGGVLDKMSFVCAGVAPHDWALSWADGGSLDGVWDDLNVFLDEINE